MAATLARHLDPEKFEAHLVLLTQSSPTGHDFPETVRVYFLGTKRARYAAFRLFALAWHLRPQVLFAGMAHLAPLAVLLRALLPGPSRVIIRQNGSHSSIFGAIGPSRLSRSILAIAYNEADAIICQTQSTADELQREVHLDRSRTLVLHNPVDILRIRQAASFPSQNCGPYLLAVGRLVPEKGFDLLLDAFAALRQDFPTLRLLIAGTGRCRQELEFQSRLLGLKDSVEFLGNVCDPYQYFPGALAFVVSSREDELPNALLEAAAAGLPIVATPASPGISTLLAGQPGVWVAQETSSVALVQTLRIALSTLQPNQRFVHEWIRPFDLVAAVTAYERVFEQIMTGDWR